MKLAWLLALLVAFTGTALATTIDGGGDAIFVEPHSFDGDTPENVAIFMDQYPWGSDAILQVLQEYGVSYTVYNSGSMGTVDLDPYDKVIIPNNQVDTDYYYILGDNQEWFEAYMSGGGCMLMCCAAYFGYPNEQITWPGGFTHYSIECINSMLITDNSHPVFNDPLPVSSSDLQGWNCSSHGSFNDLPDGAFVTVENNEYAPGTPAAFDFCWGAGGAYVIAQPIDWVGSGNPYTVNTVLYMCTENPSPVESGTWGSIKSLYK
ncbi:MAG: hypothetical protein GF330_11480 [Candidatus Eisenbacteria bacterium]|nr:hypothetical protein [Candidatus Eisenbacteria bacterium]